MSLGTSPPPSRDLEQEQKVQQASPRKNSSSHPYNRTRTGCQTCRDRKVKCDELRPTCERCQRLHLFCQWTPRLCFRDDTARILRQYPNVNKSSSRVWHHGSAPVKPSAQHDGLPSFGTLQSNEERERKADCYAAGTFIMVATPESFEHLAQYRRSLMGDRTLCPLSPRLKTSYRATSSGDTSGGELRRLDPNVHIVRTSNDIHAFLELEYEAWTPAEDPSQARSKTTAPCISVSAMVKGKENSLLADYGARIWRELAQATADHLVSYRWK